MRNPSKLKVSLICSTCKEVFILDKAVYLNRVYKQGTDPKYCSRSCITYKKVQFIPHARKLSLDLSNKVRVTSLSQMSKEKQEEMMRLYSTPKIGDSRSV